MDLFTRLEALEHKPKYGDPCNQCGLCCMLEVCGIGKIVFGEE